MSGAHIFSLVLAACIFNLVASQCSEIHLKDTHTKFIDGEYNKIDRSLYCGHRNGYKHEEGPYYMYKDDDHWYVGDDVCGSGSKRELYARVLSSEEYPENIEGDWQEKDHSGKWVDNEAVYVECDDDSAPDAEEDGLSAGAIAGITIGVLVFVILLTLIIVCACQRASRQKAKKDQPQMAPSTGLQTSLSSHVGSEPPPAYDNHYFGLTINGATPGVNLNASNLRFDIPPPCYAELVTKEDGIPSDPCVNASAINPGGQAMIEAQKPQK